MHKVFPEVVGTDGPTPLADVFAAEPGVGFSIVDRLGTIRFVNARAAELFLQSTPQAMLGKTLDELYGSAWAAERLAVFDRIILSDRPVIMRHIRNGVQLQSTIRLISEQGDQTPTFLVITTEGEHAPADDAAFDIVESELAHLGPLESLTRRELEVLALIGHGMSSPQVAAALYRSVRTIERHCDAIRHKLNRTSRVDIAAFAMRAGLRVEDSDLKRVD